MSNGGKWSVFGAENTGQTTASEHWVATTGTQSNAYWNVAEQENPAASVELFNAPTENKKLTLIYACISGINAYAFAISPAEEVTNWLIARFVSGIKIELLKGTMPKIKNGESIGISVRGGVVGGWRKLEGTTWTKIAEVVDATYAKGFSGIGSTDYTAFLNNFATGEFPAFTELEFSGITPVKTAGGTFLIASSGKKLYSINKEGTGTEIGEGFTEGKQWSVVQFNKGKAKAGGPVYLQNGTDTPQTWTGAEGKTKVEEWKAEEAAFEGKEMQKVPKGKYMTLGLERIWVANIENDTSAVRFNELKSETTGAYSDPSLWPKENVVRFDPEDGTEITGIGTVGPYVLVFKPYKCWVIHTIGSGGAPSLIRKLSDNTGCVSHRSITETPLGTFFLTADQGIYLTNGSKLTEMSYKVRPTILKMNGAQREKAAGAFFNNHYYLSFPFESSATPNRTLDYDVALKSWWFHDIAGNQWAEWEPSTGEPFLFTAPAKAKAGVVKAFIEGIYSDSGKSYTGAKGFGAYWISPWEPFFYFIFRHRIAAPFIKKRIRQFFWNGTGTMEAFQFRSFNAGYDTIPAVVNNKNMMHPETPVHLTPEVEEAWGEGEERWGMTQNQWGGIQSAARARAYSLGTATEWSFGFGNNSSEFFEVTFAAYMAQFRKS